MIAVNSNVGNGAQHIGRLAEARIADLRIRQEHPELYAPISFGVVGMDDAVGGIVLPSMIAVGGEKKIGKTVFGVHTAIQVAKSGRFVPKRHSETGDKMIGTDGAELVVPLRVLAFHLEETRWQYTDRVVTSQAPTTNRAVIRDLKLTEEHFAEMDEVQRELDAHYELYVDDSVFDADTMIKMALQYEAQVIVVDTFNLVRGGVGTNGQEKLAEISSKFLYARNKYGITSVILHHKNRQGLDFGSDALSRDADLRITVSQPKDVVVLDTDMEGVLRLHIENSRQAKGDQDIDVAVSFAQSRIRELKAVSMNFQHMETLIHD